MDKQLFDARCKRCDSINEIDFIERFGEGSPESANDFIFRSKNGFVTICPKCGMETIHEPVKMIKTKL